MIRLEDIRIGNWFMGYDDKPFKWDLSHFGLMLTDGIEIDEIIRSPILLHEDFCNSYRIDEYGYLLIDSNSKKYKLMDVGPEGEEYESYDERVEYVHQLQNLYYSLSGVELNVNL